MTLLGQSQPEADRPKGPIVAPKRQTIIGCWNVRTMAKTTRAGQIAKEINEYGIEVLGIGETRDRERDREKDRVSNTAEWREGGVHRK